MQNGVLDAADILIDRKPVGDGLGFERSVGIVRIAVAVEVPRGIDERVHGVALTTRFAAALGTLYVHERIKRFEGRASFARDLHVRWKNDGQILFGNRLRPTRRTIDDGDGRAPVALARDAPI